VVGDGSEKDRLVKKTVEERIPDVIFLGSVFAGIERYFAMSDLFVLPGEGGLAINEAMAYSLPVICSKADGTEKDLVIEGKTGYFFKNGNTEDLACCIEKIIASPEDLRSLGQAARNHVYEIASLQKAVQQFDRVLKKYGRSEKTPSKNVEST
jgi:glycosyltransferase involved in cell wall biosynthesis